MVAAKKILNTYTPRRPQDSILFQVINDNLPAFYRSLRTNPDATGLPHFVEREFERFQKCGFYEDGMSRIGCLEAKCGADYWIPTSCKCRGFCPSCGGRRMNESAINIEERVIPAVPVRQFVVSVPMPMRYWMIANHEMMLAINRIIIRGIKSFYRKKARQQGVSDGIIGAITFIQRFGSGLNSHPHYHILVLDGVFEKCKENKYEPLFHSL